MAGSETSMQTDSLVTVALLELCAVSGLVTSDF